MVASAANEAKSLISWNPAPGLAEGCLRAAIRKHGTTADRREYLRVCLLFRFARAKIHEHEQYPEVVSSLLPERCRGEPVDLFRFLQRIG